MPAEYASLKDVALKCMYNVRFDEDASNVFKTPRVQEALEEVMTFSIKLSSASPYIILKIK